MRKDRFLKVKNRLLELQKGFRELKDIEVKIKREVEELFFKPIVVSIGDMDRFLKNKMKKIRPIKSTNYIPESIRKSVGGFNPNLGGEGVILSPPVSFSLTTQKR